MAADDGFTLAEALAALLMIGLAIGGLTEGVRVIGRLQSAAGRSVAEERTLRAAGQELTRLLRGRGPFRAGDRPAFEGAPGGFSFDCGARTCGARLTREGKGARLSLTDAAGRTRSIVLPADARFEYAGGASVGATWPVADERRPLQAVSVVAAGAEGPTPLAGVRLWPEHPADCEYDMISADCRRTAP